jgi:diaminopimelate decarboxylase
LIGGGFASSNTLIDQYTHPRLASPSFDKYAEAIGNAFNASYYVKEHHPRLILETGRVLVDEAGYLISSVIGKKNLPHRTGVILDAGVNINITAWWYKQRLMPTKPFREAPEYCFLWSPVHEHRRDPQRHAFPDLYYGDTVLFHQLVRTT